MDYSQTPPDNQQGQQPYEPSQPSGGYPPPGGYDPMAPPEKRKGFNWLAFCGIGCLVLLIIAGLVTFCSYKMFAPIINSGKEVAKIQQELNTTDISTIKAEATTVDPETLIANPKAYQGEWIELTGTIAFDSIDMSAASSQFGGMNTSTNYLLEGNIMIMDMSGAPAVGSSGDTVRTWGKCYGFDFNDLKDMPLFGKSIEKGMESNPEIQENSNFVYLVTKYVEKITYDEPEMGEEVNAAPNQADEGDSGWVR